MRLCVLATLLIALAQPARAETPVCASAAVVDQLSTLLARAGRPVELDARSVGEVSIGRDRLVHCAIRAQRPGYDTNLHGMQPLDGTFVVQYTLELRQNGIFLRVD